MTQQIRLSKPGIDALLATSPNDFFLHSDYPMLKVHASGQFTTLSDGTKEIFHNLGYRPFVLVFSEIVDGFDSGDGVQSPGVFYQHDWVIEGATVTYWGYTKIYDDKIMIEVLNTNNATPGAVNGIYYIFKDEV